MYLNFSDTAKFADVAKNLILSKGYGSSFTFFGGGVFSFIHNLIFQAIGILPIMPFSIAVFFKIFGVTDFAVIATSFFYFILTLIFVFLLAKKVFGSKLVGFLSTLAVGLNFDMIHYAVSGASESPFIFEIVAASYFVSIKKKWATVVTVLLLILMYFTRPLAFIYIAGIILFWLLNNLKYKKAFVIFGLVLVVGYLFDRLILPRLNGMFFLYSVTSRGIVSAAAQATSSVTSDALRGIETASIGSNNIQIFKNIFYNLYNFYKLLPQIISPYLTTMFLAGLFIKAKENIQKSFKISVLFMFILTLLVVAASIPFFRYIHPVIPLVYIIAAGTLVEVISKFEILNSKQAPNSKFQIQKQTFIVLSSLLLILFFGVGQTVGVLLLDSRFEAKTHNAGKAPVYVELSKILKNNTDAGQVVVTNLDTWGSWYGERKTVWFPLEPKQLIDTATGKIPFDAIYLTSYKIDDDNYRMGEGWRMIFENPTDSKKWTCEGCAEIAKEYKLKGVYKVNAADDYEKENATGVLLIKK